MTIGALISPECDASLVTACRALDAKVAGTLSPPKRVAQVPADPRATQPKRALGRRAYPYAEP